MTPPPDAPTGPATAAVVTGAARGIGRGIAERLVARGHRVVVTDVDAAGAARTATEIGAAEGLAHDVRDPNAHRRVAEAAARHGRLVAWFNNAGVGWDGDLADLADEQVRGLVEVNLLGVLWGTRAALDAFGPEGGDVVQTASLSGLGPVPGLSVYAATKAAVVSLTMSVQAETPAGVRVHALCPDGVATALLEAMRDDGRASQLVHSGGRILSVDEIAEAAVALLGSRRVVRTIPTRRGALMRAATLAPSLAQHSFGLLAAQGRVRVRARRRGGGG
ncbi:SDR family oxidoreductase [Nocardioides sp. SYSU D00038]|uniref:SDR family oxidoreductase n=1 Tax=Nocardioides sp. SYSU D00038 TaxID=2812554 RepID=UPI001967EED7|nr:SDR family NAD(P)-dependent oxidoreductase [Nocardioides sp. SYSU D00038]